MDRHEKGDGGLGAIVLDHELKLAREKPPCITDEEWANVERLRAASKTEGDAQLEAARYMVEKARDCERAEAECDRLRRERDLLAEANDQEAVTAAALRAELARARKLAAWDAANNALLAGAVQRTEAALAQAKGQIAGLLELIDHAKSMSHSPWCNGVHEGTSCEGEFVAIAVIEAARAAISPEQGAPKAPTESPAASGEGKEK